MINEFSRTPNEEDITVFDNLGELVLKIIGGRVLQCLFILKSYPLLP